MAFRSKRYRFDPLKDRIPLARSLALLNHPEPIKFILKCATDDCICPITLQPIAISELDFVRDSFDPKHPEHNAIRLACKHQFTAVCLVYNWLVNDNVRCPVCNAGPPDLGLNVFTLPRHLQLPMLRHMFITNPFERSWFLFHSLYCVMETSDSKIFRIYMNQHVCTDDELVFETCCELSAHIGKPQFIRMHMEISTNNFSIMPTSLSTSCWTPLQDDFELRTARSPDGFEFLIEKFPDSIRVYFLISAALFKKTAWDHSRCNAKRFMADFVLLPDKKREDEESLAPG